MKICPNCRDTMIDSKKVCPTCHYEFPEESIKKIEENQISKTISTKKEKHVWIGIGILTVFLLIDLIFILISLFTDFTFNFGLLNLYRMFTENAGITGILIVDILLFIFDIIICLVILVYAKNKKENVPLWIKVYCLLMMSIPLGILLFTTD